MKRIALVASLVVFAACSPKAEETKPADGAATVAPAMDSAAAMDTTKKDTTMKADTTTKH